MSWRTWRTSSRSTAMRGPVPRVVAIASIVAFLGSVARLELAPSTAASDPAEILVTSASDIINGDVETVAGLRRRPGRDGISLREAIEATNYDPGVYTIRFDTALAGTVILLQSPLPPFGGGGVDLDGDIDGDNRPDVTVRSDADIGTGLHVASGGNRIAGLAVVGFEQGAVIGSASKTPVLGETFADNTLSGLVMSDVFDGIDVSAGCPSCADVWLNTTISGNSIEAEEHGIMFFIGGDGDRVEGATIADNRIRITGSALGPGINVETAGESTGASISDVLIARNIVDGSPDIGIQVGAGGNRAQEGVLEHVQILDNRLRLAPREDEFCCVGITVEAGSDSAEMAIGPPVRYLDDNTVRDVVIHGNSVEGDLPVAIEVQAGESGGSRNRIEGLVIEENIVRSTNSGLGSGVSISNGSSYSYLDRFAEDNAITNVSIRANEFTIEGLPDADVCGGATLSSAIALVGGGWSGRGNVIRDVAVDGNVIEIAHLGIAVLGGIQPTAQENVVDDTGIGANSITGAIEAVFVSSNCLGASGNVASATIDPSLVPTLEPSSSPRFGSPASPSPTADRDVGVRGSGEAPWLGWAAVIAVLAAVLAAAVLRGRRGTP